MDGRSSQQCLRFFQAGSFRANERDQAERGTTTGFVDQIFAVIKVGLSPAGTGLERLTTALTGTGHHACYCAGGIGGSRLRAQQADTCNAKAWRGIARSVEYAVESTCQVETEEEGETPAVVAMSALPCGAWS